MWTGGGAGVGVEGGGGEVGDEVVVEAAPAEEEPQSWWDLGGTRFEGEREWWCGHCWAWSMAKLGGRVSVMLGCWGVGYLHAETSWGTWGLLSSALSYITREELNL